MRTKIVTLAALLVLGACNPGGSTSDSADTGAAAGAFPNLTAAAYRLEANVHSEDGETMPIVMVRDGQKVRMEFSTTQGSSTIITDGATGESLVLATSGGRTVAMRSNTSGMGFEDPTTSWQGEMAQTATQTGPCTGAGQTGSQWSQTENGVVKTACVTTDGIILGTTEGERTVWETTSVTRGPQPADQFTLPPGVEVMDLGNLGGMMEAVKQAQGN